MVIIMLIQNENDNYIKHYDNHDDVDKDDDGYYITLSCPKIQGISFLLLRFFISISIYVTLLTLLLQ